IQSRDCVKSATHKEWTFFVREHHRLLRRQFEPSAARVIIQIAGGRVLREPFAGVAFGDVCLDSELCAGHRSGAVHSLVETKAYTDSHQRHTDRRAEIAHHLSGELLKFLFVDHVAPFSITVSVQLSLMNSAVSGMGPTLSTSK